jgi:pimeloyl-ACP methyl ester carboxylesterase
VTGESPGWRVIEIDGRRIEVADTAGPGPPLVFLHEGLGSIELWRSFPDDVRAATGARRTVVWSRPGYGRSTPVPAPWPVSYMHEQALVVLPALLARLGVERPVLIGHSDGASIALIHAGAGHDVTGLVLLAPHVFVEDVSIAGIEAARDAYTSTPLRDRLARYHDDVDSTFWGWNGAWLAPAFRAWNIEAALPGIDAPVLVVQGDADDYGTLAQLDAIEAGVRGPVERMVVAGGGHSVHTGAAAGEVAAGVAAFVNRLG